MSTARGSNSGRVASGKLLPNQSGEYGVRADGAAPRRCMLFQEHWWIEAASRGRFDQVDVTWDGKIVASLPYVSSTHRGLRYLGMPPYTHTLGPIFDLPSSKPFARGRNIRRLTQTLVAQLPAHDHFLQALDPGDESAFGFSLAGLRLGQRFTFRSAPAQDEATRWNTIDQKTRNLIKTTGNRLQVVETRDFDRFIALSRAEHPGAANHHDFPLLEAIFARCLERDCGIVLLAVRDDLSVVAAATLVWGQDLAYYWLSARDRSTSAGGANALLLWKSIELAERIGRCLDFDGYSSRSAARFLASFGEPPMLRSEIVSSSWRHDLVAVGRRLVHRKASAAGRRD